MPLANVHSPIGFRLAQPGGQRAVRRIERPVAANRATNLMIGDAYTLDANGNAFRALGSEAETASVVRGVVEGFRLQAIGASPNGPVSKDYIADSDSGFIIGIEDEEAVFVVEISSFAATEVGNDCDLTNVDGDSVPLRQSRQYLDSGTLGTGGSGQFVIVDLYQSPADNAYGNNAQVLVRILNKVI